MKTVEPIQIAQALVTDGQEVFQQFRRKMSRIAERLQDDLQSRVRVVGEEPADGGGRFAPPSAKGG